MTTDKEKAFEEWADHDTGPPFMKTSFMAGYDSALESVKPEIERLKAEAEEHEQSFDLYDRAIRSLTVAYKSAHGDTSTNLPDTARLCEWAAKEIERLRKIEEAARQVAEVERRNGHGTDYYDKSTRDACELCRLVAAVDALADREGK